MATEDEKSTSAAPSAGRRRIAFFGGSFDPPHCGHLAIARAAQRALHLDTVLFAPVGRQPLKTGTGRATDFLHRAAMTQLAIAGEPNFELSLIDAPNAEGKPNYTVDTLVRLRDDLPAAAELYLLIGADSLSQFQRWHRAAELPFLATLIVASRPGECSRVLADPDAWLPPELRVDPTAEHQAEDQGDHRTLHLVDSSGRRARICVLDDLAVAISATELRQLLSESSSGLLQTSVQNLLPDAVLDYICAHHIYVDRICSDR